MLLLQAGLFLLINLVSGSARGDMRTAGPLPCSLGQPLLFRPPSSQDTSTGLTGGVLGSNPTSALKLVTGPGPRPPTGWVGLRVPSLVGHLTVARDEKCSVGLATLPRGGILLLILAPSPYQPEGPGPPLLYPSKAGRPRNHPSLFQLCRCSELS